MPLFFGRWAMQWSDEEFRKRVEAQASARGKTLADVTREAGLSLEYFRRPPPKGGGRNIAQILKIAWVLKTDPVVLLGLDRPPAPELAEPTDEELAKIATLAASLYFHLKRRHLDEFDAKADEIIPKAIARALKIVRREFATEEPSTAAAPIE